MAFFVFCVFIAFFLLSLWLFTRFSAQKPRLYVAPASELEKALRSYVPCLNEVFYPTWWCPSGFLQTIVREFFRSCPRLSLDRELVSLEDGGELAIDWSNPVGTDDRSPIIILLPGITGTTHECAYLLCTIAEANKLGYRTVVVNQRGLGGIALKTPQTYNAAWTDDVRHVIGLIVNRFPSAPKIGCGFSMGGMILWNYLAKCGSAETCGLKAAMCISAPFDPMESTSTIEKFFPRLFFNSRLAENLKKIIRPYKKLFEGRCNWDGVMACKTIREFDELFTAPLFGYKDYTEYYHAAALYYKVHQIPVPTVCLNAADDCFSPAESIPVSEVLRSKNVAVAVTHCGGHLAFMNHANPSAPGLIEDLFIQFTAMILSRNSF